MNPANAKTDSLTKGHRERIRQRFIEYGADVLAEYEKLELLLTIFIPRKDVKAIAKNLIAKFGSIHAMFNASDSELIQIDGIGKSVICNINILRMCLEANFAGAIKQEPLSLESVDLIVQYFERRLAPLDHEVLDLICLDSQLKLIGNSAIRIFEGSIDSVDVDLRRIIEIAIKKSASSIVLAHNHPRGEASPSASDIDFTKKLSKTCRNLKLDFIEHIIIAKDRFFSFRRNGYLDILYDETISSKQRSKVASPKKILKD